MSKTSCISHAANLPMVIIRKDYLDLCNGNSCQAAVLAVMEYWTNIKLAQREQAEITNEKESTLNEPAFQDASLWIWKTYEQLVHDLLGVYSRNSVIAAIQTLENRSLIFSRTNPRYKWDRTKQYMLNIDAVQTAISNDPSSKKGRSKADNETIKDPDLERAIPETTTETTTENQNNNAAPQASAAASWRAQEVLKVSSLDAEDQREKKYISEQDEDMPAVGRVILRLIGQKRLTRSQAASLSLGVKVFDKEYPSPEALYKEYPDKFTRFLEAIPPWLRGKNQLVNASTFLRVLLDYDHKGCGWLKYHNPEYSVPVYEERVDIPAAPPMFVEHPRFRQEVNP